MKYLDQYKEIHSKKKYGVSGDRLVDKLYQVINPESESLLDYGAGQANTARELGKRAGLDRLNVDVYDPAVVGRDKLPSGGFDTVICTDVLEHVPEEELNQVLTDIWGYAKREAIFVIALRLAGEILPNGENAHCTVHPKEWWYEKLRSVFTEVVDIPSFEDKYSIAGFKCTKEAVE